METLLPSDAGIGSAMRNTLGMQEAMVWTACGINSAEEHTRNYFHLSSKVCHIGCLLQILLNICYRTRKYAQLLMELYKALPPSYMLIIWLLNTQQSYGSEFLFLFLFFSRQTKMQAIPNSKDAFSFYSFCRSLHENTTS